MIQLGSNSLSPGMKRGHVAGAKHPESRSVDGETTAMLQCCNRVHIPQFSKNKPPIEANMADASAHIAHSMVVQTVRARVYNSGWAVFEIGPSCIIARLLRLLPSLGRFSNPDEGIQPKASTLVLVA